jgi:hypothetical protein
MSSLDGCLGDAPNCLSHFGAAELESEGKRCQNDAGKKAPGSIKTGVASKRDNPSPALVTVCNAPQSFDLEAPCDH